MTALEEIPGLKVRTAAEDVGLFLGKPQPPQQQKLEPLVGGASDPHQPIGSRELRLTGHVSEDDGWWVSLRNLSRVC